MRVGWCLPTMLLLLAAAGCKQTPAWMQSQPQQAQLQQLQQQQLAAAQQQQSLQAAASSMDRLNQEKEQQLALSRQELQQLQVRVAALSTRLTETTADLTRERADKVAVQKKFDDLLAANRRTGTVSITANSSHTVDLAAVEIRGVDVRRDGDVIRVTLPSSQLFAPGSAQLAAGGGSLLDTVAVELARAYPQQLIGVEGHADGATPTGAAGQNPQQVSTLRAMAVYNYLASRGSLRTEQLHVAGYGANHPLYSNATPAGREANQRIELVVYPETVRNNTR
ncbi:MAG: OmpA family protein [Planctomycetia bacterium]|nr:OmpA family protein [Planctomycetia bacterium]